MEKRNFSYIVLLLILVSSCATNFENEKSVLLSKTTYQMRVVNETKFLHQLHVLKTEHNQN